MCNDKKNVPVNKCVLSYDLIMYGITWNGIVGALSYIMHWYGIVLYGMAWYYNGTVSHCLLVYHVGFVIIH